MQLVADGWRSPSSAETAMNALRPLLRWAAQRDMAKAEDWRSLESPTPRPAAEGVGKAQAGGRRLAPEEIQTLWPQLTGGYGEASRFLLWTAARLREATGMTWSEVAIDGPAGSETWTLPAARRKNLVPDGG